jgi:hypothetical protein
MLPFSYEQFLQVFALYNETIFPVQFVAYLLAALMVAALFTGATRLVGLGLGLMWLWTGVGYHWLHFTAINKAAWAFGALFVVQGLLFLYASVVSRRLQFGPGNGATGLLGWAYIAYAAVIYPLLGMWTGHAYPQMPMFGVTPCPVTIFTFGLLLLAGPRVPLWLLPIPLVWSLIGGSAAFLLQVPQDWFLLVSGIAAIPIAMAQRARRAPVTA